MNKTFILFCVFLLGATCLHAQTSSGNMMVGGALNFYSRSYQAGSANNDNGVEFRPGFGYFISDNFAVGAELAIGSYKDGTPGGKTVTTAFAFGPFARYYMFTSNESFGFFGQAQIAFGTEKTDNPAPMNDPKSSTFAFALSPGAAYFFNEHWALELLITGFRIDSEDPNKDAEDDKTTTVRFGLSSLQPQLGLRYHF